MVAGALVAFLLIGSATFGSALQDEAWKQGWQAYNEGDYSQAEQHFRTALEDYDNWGWLHMMLGVTLHHRSKNDEALTELEKAKELVEEDENRFQVNHAIGQIHIARGNFDQAIAAESEALQYAGGNAQFAASAERGLGAAYYQQDRWQQAIDHLETAAETRTGDGELFAMLGRAYYESGNNSAAMENLQKATELDRDNRTALYFLGQLYLSQRDWDAAVRVAERAVQSDPQDPAIRNMLGRAYLGAKRYDDAVNAFQIVLQDDRAQGQGNAYYNLGQAYQGSDQTAKAIEAYRNALDHLTSDATRAEALYDLGIAYETVGRYEDALGALQDAAEIQETPKLAEALERVQERIRREKETEDAAA